MFEFFDLPSDVAKRYCQRCPVVVECLEYGLADPGLKGIWGGLSEKQRNNERARKGRV